MDRNHLNVGRIIFPNKLNLPKGLKVGIIGSGKIAEEYIKVIRSFNHSLEFIYSVSKNPEANKIAKKNKARLLKSIKEIFFINDVDFWIVCTSWSKLRKIFFSISKIDKPILFEKSLIIKTTELKKIKNQKKYNSFVKNLSFAFNRNHYDYMHFLNSTLIKNEINYGCAYLYDPFHQLVKNKKITKKYLTKYITSHWISLILKIFQIANFKIIKMRLDIINRKLNHRKLTFFLKSKKNEFNFDIFHFPNLPKNHQINFFLNSKIIEISPIEKIMIFDGLEKKKIKSQNKYIPKSETIIVNDKYKPGFRYQYFNFINKNFFNKNSCLLTDFENLIKIYEISELLNVNEN